MRRLFLFFFSLLLVSPSARAASCCGGGFAVPSLITGDERGQFSADVSYSVISADVTPAGIWRPRDSAETSTTTRFSGAIAAFERAQFGASLPFVSRSRGENSQGGFGDLQLTGGYEIWTDWDYSSWRPKLIGFVSLSVPAGRSVQDANAEYKLDSRGRGYWAFSIGALARKALRKWDVFSTFDVHNSFAKESAGGIREVPGWGGSLGAGIGYTFGETRLGTSMISVYEDPVRTEGAIVSSGALSRHTALAFSLSHDIVDPSDPDGPPLSFSLAYTDQTLLGAPSNTALSKTVSLTLLRRWAR